MPVNSTKFKEDNNSQEDRKAVAVGASSLVLERSRVLSIPFMSDVNRKEVSVFDALTRLSSLLPVKKKMSQEVQKAAAMSGVILDFAARSPYCIIPFRLTLIGWKVLFGQVHDNVLLGNTA